MASGLFYLQCRVCRNPLISSQQLDKEGCTSKSLWFVSSDGLPEWIENLVNKESWQKGKLYCPKCNGRVGSFNFIKVLKCSECNSHNVSPIHLLRDRVDQKLITPDPLPLQDLRSRSFVSVVNVEGSKVEIQSADNEAEDLYKISDGVKMSICEVDELDNLDSDEDTLPNDFIEVRDSANLFDTSSGNIINLKHRVIALEKEGCDSQKGGIALDVVNSDSKERVIALGEEDFDLQERVIALESSGCDSQERVSAFGTENFYLQERVIAIESSGCDSQERVIAHESLCSDSQERVSPLLLEHMTDSKVQQNVNTSSSGQLQGLYMQERAVAPDLSCFRNSFFNMQEKCEAECAPFGRDEHEVALKIHCHEQEVLRNNEHLITDNGHNFQENEGAEGNYEYLIADYSHNNPQNSGGAEGSVLSNNRSCDDHVTCSDPKEHESHIPDDVQKLSEEGGYWGSSHTDNISECNEQILCFEVNRNYFDDINTMDRHEMTDADRPNTATVTNSNNTVTVTNGNLFEDIANEHLHEESLFDSNENVFSAFENEMNQNSDHQGIGSGQIGQTPEGAADVDSPLNFDVLEARGNRRRKKGKRKSKREKRQLKKELRDQSLEDEAVWEPLMLDFPDEHTCPVCFDLFCEPHKIVPCDHMMCEACLRRLGQQNVYRTLCPMCRQHIIECNKDTDLIRALVDIYPEQYRARRREQKKYLSNKFSPLPHRQSALNYNAEEIRNRILGNRNVPPGQFIKMKLLLGALLLFFLLMPVVSMGRAVFQSATGLVRSLYRR